MLYSNLMEKSMKKLNKIYGKQKNTILTINKSFYVFVFYF